MKKIIQILFLLAFISNVSLAQVAYKVDDESTITITGTSTIHDWTSKVNEINGVFIFKNEITQKKLPKSGSIVEQVKLIIPVLSIESPRGSTMDNKTYNALKSETYPDLIFEVTSDNLESIIDKAEGKFLLRAYGVLSMAGESKEINVSLECQRMKDGRLKISGAYPIDMLEYKIEPPSAMFGQIKTGKDLMIDFELILSAK